MIQWLFCSLIDGRN